jgi:transposase
MTQYTYKCQQRWVGYIDEETQFNTNDQKLWDELRDECEALDGSGNFDKKFPKQVSSNVNLWLKLFQTRDYYSAGVDVDSIDWDHEGRVFSGEITDEKFEVIATGNMGNSEGD